MVEVVIACGALAVLSSIALMRPERVLLLAVFLAPWHGLDVDVGVRITAFRVVAGVLVASGLIRIVLGKQRSWVKPSGIFWVFVAYGIVLSVLQVPRGAHAEVAGGILRGSTLRALLQILLFAGELALIPLAAQMIRGPEWIRRVARVYIASCFVLSVLGWLQIGTWLSIGWNPFPIGLFHSLVRGEQTESVMLLREGTFDLHGTTIVRMNALGGEPKGLGTGLAVGLVMIQAAFGTGAIVVSRRVVVVWLFLFASMLATFSTSGFVLWTLGSLMSALGGLRPRSGALRGAVLVVCLPLVAGMVALTVAAAAPLGNGVNWLDLALERTVGRDYVEDFDEAVGLFLVDHPTAGILGVGLGNIHLYANDYLPEYATAYARGTAFTAKSGALRLVSELGLIGLFLFFAWFMIQIRSASRLVRHLDTARSWTPPDLATLICLVQLSVMIALMYLARGAYVSPQTFLTFGLLVAVGVRRSVTVTKPARFPTARVTGASVRSIGVTR